MLFRVIHFIGHTSTHKPHPLQRIGLIATFFLGVINLVAFASGQVFIHILQPIQPMHLVSSTAATRYIFSTPLYRLYNIHLIFIIS